MGKYFEKFFVLTGLLKKAGKLFRGTTSSPFLCFGLLTAFLLTFVSLGSGFILKSLSSQEGFSLATVSDSFYKTAEPPLCTQQSLFVAPNENFQRESPDFILVGGSVIQAATPPTTFSAKVLGSLMGGYEAEEKRKEISEYTVEEGDSLYSIAASLDISLETLLGANSLNKNSVIQPGQKLVILPISGILHHVKDGDTISEIARIYKGKVDEIVAFNSLANENDIYVGDIIIVPDGIMPVPLAQSQQSLSSVPLADSYFIPPVFSPYIITQGLHWYNAIDFSHSGYSCGKPVLAAAGGKVQKTGYDRTAGNYIRILHPNGVVTFYGHLSTILVSAGQSVYQGSIIGYIGNTGYTIGETGCHVHFEVRGARNPFAY